MAARTAGWAVPASRGPSHRDYTCAAPGCPLAAALSESTRGEGQAWCRVHFGRPEADHDRLTLEAVVVANNPRPGRSEFDTQAVADMRARLYRPEP
jgi:hypothetical protein